MNDFVRPHYAKAPIVEALIDIRLSEPDAVDLGIITKVADALASNFPTRMPIQQFELGVQHDLQKPEDTKFLNQHRQLGWRLHSPAGDRVLLLQKTGFTYSHLPPYSKWEVFKDEAQHCWEAFRKAMPTISVARIAVRVINKIAIPKGEIDISRYFNIYPVVPEEIPATADSLFVQLQLAMPHVFPAARAIINVARDESNPSTPELILDIDLFSNESNPAEQEIWEKLEKFGLQKDVIFENCITEEVRKIIQ